MSRRILVLGAYGQVGSELQRSLANLGEVVPWGRDECNFEEPQVVARKVLAFGADVVVNAAAYTAVDKAESECDRAMLINADTPRAIAEALAKQPTLFVHLSSDYVFDGHHHHPYKESDNKAPRSAYGKSKLVGDDAVMAAGGTYVVLRTSWVFGAHGQNFLKTILRLAKQQEVLRVVADQTGTPTSAVLIADQLARVVRRYFESDSTSAIDAGARVFPSGVYHCTAAGACSWHEYAVYIVGYAQAAGMGLMLSPNSIQAISTEQYPLPAPRPAYSCLDCSKFESTFGVSMPHWHQGVSDVLDTLLSERL